MDKLNQAVYIYTQELEKGAIQQAYKGIITFMNSLATDISKQYPVFYISAVYPGYMDMTYFAVTPLCLKDKQLKIAVVYLHEEMRFELWLAAANRKLQREYSKKLEGKDLLSYNLTKLMPGVDAVIDCIACDRPDFDNLETLKQALMIKLLAFTEDMVKLVNAI